MILKEELDAFRRGEKVPDGDLMRELMNMTGNSQIANLFNDLIASFVEVATGKAPPPKPVKPTPVAAPAAPGAVDTASIVSQVLAQLVPLLQQAQAAPPVSGQGSAPGAGAHE